MVSLRPWSDDDVAAKVAWGRDPAIVRWTGAPAEQTAQMSRQHASQAEAARRAGRAISFAIAQASSDQVIGSCDVRLIDPDDPGLGEIGYLLGPDARGHGLATRAMWLLTNWCFEQLQIDRVQALVRPGNPASAGF